MLRVYDGAGRLIVEVEGPWLHPVVWLFSQEAASVREVLAGDSNARVFDSVVGTAALGCYRLLGVGRVAAELSDTNTADLARAWRIALSAERTVPAIQCNAEADVAALAEQNGGVPDPAAVLAMLKRRARARPVAVSVRRPGTEGADADAEAEAAEADADALAGSADGNAADALAGSAAEADADALAGSADGNAADASAAGAGQRQV